jgi:kynurenine formamidase
VAIVAITLLCLPASGQTTANAWYNKENAGDLENNSFIENPSLWQVYDILKSKDYVDLTHNFRPGIPHWEAYPDEIVETIFNYSTSGFLAQKFNHVGQWGTRVDTPAHFNQGKRTVDQIDVKEMLLPLVVLDVHQKVLVNPDYTITMDDVKAWESRYGKIPEGCFVALRTDWSKRGPNQTAMLNRDRNGTFHFPGWSMEVLRCLI